MKILTDEKIKKLFDACLKDADRLIAQEGALLDFANKMDKKFSAEADMTKLGRIPVLADQFKACVLGTGNELSPADLRIVMAGLIYYVLPYDVIPDKDEKHGYDDDKAIADYAISLLKG